MRSAVHILSQDGLVIVGFVNLMLAVAEAGRPDLWARLSGAWVRHPLFRLHGLLLLSLAGLFVFALPVPRFEPLIWLSVLLMAGLGGMIVSNPDSVRRPLLESYLDRPDDETRRLTYVDAAFRACVGLFFIFSVRGG